MGLRLGGTDPLGQATVGRAAELGRGSVRVGMEPDTDAHGDEGLVSGLGILWGFPFLSPISVPKLEQEAILTS